MEQETVPTKEDKPKGSQSSTSFPKIKPIKEVDIIDGDASSASTSSSKTDPSASPSSKGTIPKNKDAKVRAHASEASASPPSKETIPKDKDAKVRVHESEPSASSPSKGAIPKDKDAKVRAHASEPSASPPSKGPIPKNKDVRVRAHASEATAFPPSKGAMPKDKDAKVRAHASKATAFAPSKGAIPKNKDAKVRANASEATSFPPSKGAVPKDKDAKVRAHASEATAFPPSKGAIPKDKNAKVSAHASEASAFSPSKGAIPKDKDAKVRAHESEASASSWSKGAIRKDKYAKVKTHVCHASTSSLIKGTKPKDKDVKSNAHASQANTSFTAKTDKQDIKKPVKTFSARDIYMQATQRGYSRPITAPERKPKLLAKMNIQIEDRKATQKISSKDTKKTITVNKSSQKANQNEFQTSVNLPQTSEKTKENTQLNDSVDETLNTLVTALDLPDLPTTSFSNNQTIKTESNLSLSLETLLAVTATNVSQKHIAKKSKSILDFPSTDKTESSQVKQRKIKSELQLNKMEFDQNRKILEKLQIVPLTISAVEQHFSSKDTKTSVDEHQTDSASREGGTTQTLENAVLAIIFILLSAAKTIIYNHKLNQDQSKSIDKREEANSQKDSTTDSSSLKSNETMMTEISYTATSEDTTGDEEEIAETSSARCRIYSARISIANFETTIPEKKSEIEKQNFIWKLKQVIESNRTELEPIIIEISYPLIEFLVYNMVSGTEATKRMILALLSKIFKSKYICEYWCSYPVWMSRLINFILGTNKIAIAAVKTFSDLFRNAPLHFLFMHLGDFIAENPDNDQISKVIDLMILLIEARDSEIDDNHMKYIIRAHDSIITFTNQNISKYSKLRKQVGEMMRILDLDVLSSEYLPIVLPILSNPEA